MTPLQLKKIQLKFNRVDKELSAIRDQISILTITNGKVRKKKK